MQKPYLNYKEKFKTRNMFLTLSNVLTILLILALLFLPMFSYEQVVTLEAFGGDVEKYLQYLATIPPEQLLSGKVPVIKENFSLFDELLKNISCFSSNSTDESSYIAIVMIMLPAVTTLTSALYAYNATKEIFARLNTTKDFDNYCLLEYSALKKTCGQADQVGLYWKKQTTFQLGLFYIFTLAFGKFFVTLFSDIAPTNLLQYTHMGSASISGWIVVGIILFLANLYLSAKAKKQTKELILEIQKEELNENKEQPTTDTTTTNQ